MKPHVKKLEGLRACRDAVEWASRFKSEQETWDKCERGDWMLWYVGKCVGEPKTVSKRKLVLAACKCARLALPHAKTPKAKEAIEIAEAWARQKKSVTLEDVRNAANAAAAAAAAAANAAYTAYTADAAAADAAAYAADAAAANAAAAAADAAAYAADAAAAAKMKTLKKCADIIRKFYPKPPKLKKGLSR